MSLTPFLVRKICQLWFLVVPFWLLVFMGANWSGKPHETHEILRLTPSKFSDLPSDIREKLEHRGCTIPQPYDHLSSSPANVVQAEFATQGQLDWAVLCSRQGTSTILVFWGGPVQCATQLHGRSDAGYLQSIGRDQKGFSREISAITPGGMRALAEAFGEDRVSPPGEKHEGLSDAYLGKASEVLYCMNGTWVDMAGAE